MSKNYKSHGHIVQVELGNRLFERHFFHHVVKDHCFKDEYLFYRFLEDEEVYALNMQDST